MKKKILLSILVLVFITGCKSIPKLQNGQESVADSTGGMISVDELYNEMKEDYALSKLIDMIDTKILKEKFPENAEELEYIQKEMEQARMMYDNYYRFQYSTYEQFIGQYYGARDDDQLKVVLSLASKKKRAVQDYAERTITEKELKKYYEDKYIGDMEASHILIKVDSTSNSTEEEKKAAEEKALKDAKDIIAKLDKGEKFGDLAKKHSEDGSANNEGKLNRFSHKTMVKEFEDATYKLKEGEYTKTPVKTQFGYHIILKHKQYDKEELSKVEKNIRKYIADDLINEDEMYSYKALIEIRKENKVEIKDSKIKEQYENYIYNVTK